MASAWSGPDGSVWCKEEVGRLCPQDKLHGGGGGEMWGRGSFTTCLVSGCWLQKEFQVLLTSLLSPAGPLIRPFLQRSAKKPSIQGFLSCLILNMFPPILSLASPYPSSPWFKTKAQKSKQRAIFIYFGYFRLGKGAHSFCALVLHQLMCCVLYVSACFSLVSE